MRLLPTFFVTLALLLPLAAAPRAEAQALRFATDSTAPIDLAAGLMVWQRAAGHAQLNKDAQMRQGPLTLSADQLAIKFADNGTAENIRADGQVVLLSAASDDSAPRRATARQAFVDLEGQTIILTGDVTMTDGADAARQLSGARLSLDMVSGRARLTGGVDKPRARIELR
ncbi:MAG: LptA/OstA family protein [Parvibaculales bacterium]